VACDCHSKCKETAKSTSRLCSSLSPWMCSPLPCPPLPHPLSHLIHLPSLLVAVFLLQVICHTLELSPSLLLFSEFQAAIANGAPLLAEVACQAVSLKMQTHVLPMLTVRGTRLKRANALFLSPATNSMAKRCASSLHWHLATELILNLQHTDTNTRLAPGDDLR
jgi:hypothetical protein